MEISKKAWPISSMYGIRAAINTNPDYQRPAVWSSAQKQLLVDSVLRGYDVPKFYWRQVSKKPVRFDVVDGQQRIRAICEFCDGKYGLPKDADAIDGNPIAGLKCQELPFDLRIKWDTYNLDVVVMDEADEDETREMFLRLQNGTSLKAQEKRNAMKGNMRDFVKALAMHPIFSVCGFSNSRYVYDQVAAQMVLLELSGGPCNVKNADLNRMYEKNEDFDSNGAKAKKSRKVLDVLYSAFPSKTPELERFNLVSLYSVASQLLENYVIKDRVAELADWFLKFESYRREQDQLPSDEADNEIVIYHEKTSHSTDAADSLTWRHEFLLRKFFEAVPDVELKDDQRLFTYEQRLAIYRRDGAVCKVALKCDGGKCEWENWAADHIKPWSKGGKTTVENGQVSCIACNSAKKDSAQAAPVPA
jgi:Protein of unknown function DUF262/HNH endonuclease